MGKKITNGKKYESDSEEDLEGQEVEDQDEELEQEEEEDEEQDYQSNSDILDKDDSDSEGSENGAGRAGLFGNKKQDYYKDSDVTDSDDSGEEHGADEIYRQQQKGLTEADFMDEDFAKKESDESQDEEIAEAQEDPKKFKEEEKERKQKLIKKLSPEIMSLAQEMNISMSEICDKLFPLIEIEEAKKIMTGKGQNFLEIRYEILISYTMCILFYLMLKSKGKITNNHPVLDRLTKYKTHIERMNISLGDFEEKVGEAISNHLKNKKKINKNGNKERQLTFEEKMKLNQKSQQKPKKESESQKLARQIQEELQNLQGLSEEDSNDFGLDDMEGEQSEQDLLSEDEEDMRITKGAKATKKQSSKAAPSKNHDDGEINMESVEKFLQDDEDDDDMLLQEPKKVNLNKIKQQQNKKIQRNPEEFEDDFYKQIKQNQLDENISKKRQKIIEKEKKKEEIQKSYQIRELKEEDSRKITPQILNNKGNLVRKRKKDSGNARVSNRRKWEKKDKVHRKQHGAQVYAKQLNYSGELGAIKVGIKKSTKL